MNKTKKKILVLMISLFISASFSFAQYNPYLSTSTNLHLSQNIRLENNELPLRTTYNIELEVSPLNFRFKSFTIGNSFSLASVSKTISYNNTALLGFSKFSAILNLGYSNNFYAISIGAGFDFNQYIDEPYFFFSLTGILKQSIKISNYIDLVIPIKFTYRRELIDYNIGLGFCYYPMRNVK